MISTKIPRDNIARYFYISNSRYDLINQMEYKWKLNFGSNAGT